MSAERLKFAHDKLDQLFNAGAKGRLVVDLLPYHVKAVYADLDLESVKIAPA